MKVMLDFALLESVILVYAFLLNPETHICEYETTKIKKFNQNKEGAMK